MRWTIVAAPWIGAPYMRARRASRSAVVVELGQRNLRIRKRPVGRGGERYAVAPASAHLRSYDLAQRSVTVQIFADPPLLAWGGSNLSTSAMYQQFFGRLVEIGLEPGGVLCEDAERVEASVEPERRRLRHAKSEPL